MDCSVKWMVKNVCDLINNKQFDRTSWDNAIRPYLSPFVGEDAAKAISKTFAEKCIKDIGHKMDDEDDDDEGEDLCDCKHWWLCQRTGILTISMRSAFFWFLDGCFCKLAGIYGASQKDIENPKS